MSRRDYIKHYTSPSEPSDAQAGDEWYNTSTNKIYKKLIDGGTSTSWIEISQQRNVSSLIPSVTTPASTSIATATGSDSSSRISFTNIPQTYKNLQLLGRISSSYTAHYYLCADFYKNNVRQQVQWAYGQFYNYQPYTGTNNYGDFATLWYGGTYSPAKMSGTLEMMFSDYTNHIACAGIMSGDHGYSAAPHISIFGITNRAASGFIGFDQIDIYWTNTGGVASGTQYLTTNTKLTLYGIS